MEGSSVARNCNPDVGVLGWDCLERDVTQAKGMWLRRGMRKIYWEARPRCAMPMGSCAQPRDAVREECASVGIVLYTM